MNENILRRHIGWQRMRWNILGVFLCSVTPYLIRLWSSPLGEGPELLNVTLFGSITASIFSLFLLRSLSNYPGVQGSVYILPSFMSGFSVVFFIFLFGRLNYSRYVFLASFALCVIWFYAAYFRAQRRKGIKIGIVPVGAASTLMNIDRFEWRILSEPGADASDLSAIAVDLRVDLPDEWERRLTDYALEGLPVYHSKQLLESLTGQVELEHLSENSFGSLAPVSAYMTFKHCFDWVTAAVLLIAISPLLLAVAAAVRLDSAGPVIFRQRRIGYRGRSFTVYKFRSMAAKSDPNSEARAHAITLSNDQRVTRIGRFLRTSRLDELPQLLNVLKGEMSLIGPRPEAEVLSRWYEAEIPFYRYRHIVRPGISGWAQVNQGHVAEVEDVRHKLHYDFYYIKHFSPWIDVLIVARTIRTMVTGFGAR